MRQRKMKSNFVCVFILQGNFIIKFKKKAVEFEWMSEIRILQNLAIYAR